MVPEGSFLPAWLQTGYVITWRKKSPMRWDSATSLPCVAQGTEIGWL